SLDGDGNRERGLGRRRHRRPAADRVDRDACRVARHHAVALGLFHHGGIRARVDVVVVVGLRRTEGRRFCWSCGVPAAPPTRPHFNIQPPPLPRNLGPDRGQVPRGCRVVFLHFLAAEISPRCARFRHQGGGRGGVDSFRSGGGGLPPRRRTLELAA